jgi:hypothetical protein
MMKEIGNLDDQKEGTFHGAVAKADAQVCDREVFGGLA